MTRAAPKTAHRAALMHFTADPAARGESSCEYFDDGLLVIDGRGLIVECGAAKSLMPKYAGVPVTVHKNAMLAPGFVDTHTHFPQTGIVASYGADLLDWLNRYTFPAEEMFADERIAEDAAKFFIKQMLANGTTTALVFATSHKTSADAIFTQARKHNMRLASGKVLMNRNAPKNLRDNLRDGEKDTRALIRRWHGDGRLSYAITPRFAPTSTPSQLSLAGKLLREFPDVLMHTHLSENRRELKWVRELFPNDDDYLAVYEKRGLACERSVFAHCVHLSQSEWRRLSSSGCAVAHCPLSNFFLGSGMFDFAKAQKHKVRAGLGTDIGGGNSFSMLRVMEESYKTARMLGKDLTPLKMWHTATLGGASALAMDSRIGNFAAGKEADFIVLNLSPTELITRRLRACQTTSEKLFALAMLADDRLIKSAHILGKKQTP